MVYKIRVSKSVAFYNQNQCNEMHYRDFMLILIPFWRVVQLWMFEQKGWLPAVFWMNWWCQKYVITVQIRSSHHSSLSGTNWKTNGVEDHHSWKFQLTMGPYKIQISCLDENSWSPINPTTYLGAQQKNNVVLLQNEVLHIHKSHVKLKFCKIIQSEERSSCHLASSPNSKMHTLNWMKIFRLDSSMVISTSFGFLQLQNRRNGFEMISVRF